MTRLGSTGYYFAFFVCWESERLIRRQCDETARLPVFVQLFASSVNYFKKPGIKCLASPF